MRGTRSLQKQERMSDREPWLLRPEEAAALLSVSRSKVYELMAANVLPSITIGRTRRIDAQALRQWLDAQGG